MKKYAITFGALILIGAMGAVASAQPVSGYAEGKFERGYLDFHPEVARQLAHNPGLVDNPEFMASHRELAAYLQNHPEVRREIKHHPQAFMSGEWHHEVWGGGGPGGRPLASTDRYMDAHPEVAEKLEKNPGLVDNPAFMAEHPGLHEYLQNHPVARHEWREHPHKYMSAEKNYQKTH
jgi:hypothetical protein